MPTIARDKLKSFLERIPRGSPLPVGALASYGISADLAVYYVRSGWMTRLARGVYCRPGEPLSRDASLVVLQKQIDGFHVGGKTALEWYGIRHYVPSQEVLRLYGWADARLPEWFSQHFAGVYHRKRLFHERGDAMLYVTPFEGRNEAPLTAAPERALLELLSEVGVRQPFQEAREIMESAYSMRPEVLGSLLQQCASVKTVRLCLQLAGELQLDWLGKLDVENLPTGSDRPWVSRSRDGLLILRP